LVTGFTAQLEATSHAQTAIKTEINRIMRVSKGITNSWRLQEDRANPSAAGWPFLQPSGVASRFRQ
jgi:hypothetical protein